MEITFNETSKIRLDKWLAYKFPKKSREFFNNNIKNGNILLNAKIIKPSTMMEMDDKVFIDDQLLEDVPEKTLAENENIFLDIVFENEQFLVINKPAGILTHPTSKNEANTIANAIITKFPQIRDVGEDKNRPGIVHRLDKNTSGVLIVAKNNDSFEKLKEMFKERKIKKTYTALVFGKVKHKNGIINLPLARSKSKYNRRKVSSDSASSKEAITEYEVIKYYKDHTLLLVMPKTGRTHQIRVHLAALSHFVVGDNEYGSKKTNLSSGLARHFLHAGKIEFSFDNYEYCFEAKLPEELSSFLKTLPS